MLRRIFILFVLISFWAPAFGQEPADLEKRVKALEEENARLRKALAEAGARLREAAEALERAAGKPRPAEEPEPAPALEGEPAPDDSLFGRLKAAHVVRDEAKVRASEDALFEAAQTNQALADEIRAAFGREQQFNTKVSLEWVLLRLDRRANLRDMIKVMQSTKEPGEKMRYAFMLGKLRIATDEEAAELGRALADEQDPMIKKYLVRTGGLAKHEQASRILAKIVRESEDRNLRIEAIRALEERGTASPVLVEIAQNEQDASIRSIAIRALATTAGEESKAFFFKLLATDERTNNRAEAAKYFHRVGAKADIARLESLYEADRVYYIRQKIRQAIEAIQGRSEAEPR